MVSIGKNYIPKVAKSSEKSPMFLNTEDDNMSTTTLKSKLAHFSEKSRIKEKDEFPQFPVFGIRLASPMFSKRTKKIGRFEKKGSDKDGTVQQITPEVPTGRGFSLLWVPTSYIPSKFNI